MTDALITPRVLTWARERRQFDVATFASKVSVRPEVAASWEAGTSRPTFLQAANSANALRVPLGYFYLPEPPTLSSPLPDFRTLPGQTVLEPGPELLDVIVDVLGKQEWYREYLVLDGSDTLPFVGRFSTDDSIEEVAADIREVLQIDAARRAANNADDFVRELARKAESAGILVMRSGVVRNDNARKLNPNEFRGFSVSDSLAPVVFVNAQDAKNAQVFSIVHELAHIWIGQGGISSPYSGPLALVAEEGIERYCDSIAAESLVPTQGFRSEWRSAGGSASEAARRLSSQFRVSAFVILRKAFDSDLVEEDEYWRLNGEMRQEASSRKPGGESGGNFHYTLLARNGAQFTNAVISSAARGTLLLAEAADLLGISAKTLPRVARHNFGSTLNLG